MKTIFLIRHGQTKENSLGIVQGSGVNSDLNDTGRQQAQDFYNKYKNENFEIVLTSTLKRTHQTADGFIKAGISWEQFAEIREISWGVQEGQVPTEASIATYKAVVTQWGQGNMDARLDEGESAAELEARCRIFIEILKKRPEQKILIVAHGRTMRCLLCLLKNVSLKSMSGQKHSNTGLYKMTYQNDQFTFELENDTSHLQKTPKL